MFDSTSTLIETLKNERTQFKTESSVYSFFILMVNKANNYCVIPAENIRALTIIDNFYNPFFDAILSITNENHSIENSKSTEFIKFTINNFIPLNNGQDMVFIYITEYDEDPLKFINSYNTNLIGLFTIESVEDAIVDGELIKTYKLKDNVEKCLQETKGQFSTALYSYRINTQKNFNFSEINTFKLDTKLTTNDYNNFSQLTNDERSLTTGCSIALLLKNILSSKSVIDTNNFDFGGPKIFYNAAPDETNLETLNNLLFLHNARSDNKDRCYLDCYYDIVNDNYVWSFLSLSDIYKFKDTKRGNVLGQFDFTFENNQMDTKDQKTLDNYILKSISWGGRTSNVSQYLLSDFTANDNLKNIGTKVIYNYDIQDKKFLIDNTSSNLSNILKSFKSSYFNVSGYPNTPIAPSQIDNLNAEHIINQFNTDTNISYGRNIAMQQLLYMNNAIEFTTTGNILWQAGYFITMNANNVSADNQYFIKLLGDGFITNIQHIFTPLSYNTKLTISKPYFLQEPYRYKENYTINE